MQINFFSQLCVERKVFGCLKQQEIFLHSVGSKTHFAVQWTHLSFPAKMRVCTHRNYAAAKSNISTKEPLVTPHGGSRDFSRSKSPWGSNGLLRPTFLGPSLNERRLSRVNTIHVELCSSVDKMSLLLHAQMHLISIACVQLHAR